MSDSPASQPILQQAVAHHQAGRLQQAEMLYRQVLAAHPDQPDALHLLGVIAAQSGRHDDGINLILRAIQAKPCAPEFHLNLAKAHWAQRKLDPASAALNKALELAGGSGLVLRESAAIAGDFLRALRAAPTYISAIHMGNILRELGRLEDALAVHELARQLKPDAAPAHVNLGADLYYLGRFDEALRCFERALAIKGDYPEPHLFRGILLLLRGDLAQGLGEYEWRLKVTSAKPWRSSDRPLWDGTDPSGKTLLLYPEQGLGDVIHFVRYIPLLAAKGGRIILELQPPLRRLLTQVPGIDQIIDPADAAPPHDVHCGLLSLPRLLKTTLDTIPADIPYLRADNSRVEKWRKLLEPHAARFKVGLVWAGSPHHRNDRNRSIPLSMFAPLGSISDVTFFSIQKGPAAGQGATAPFALFDHTAQLTDFSETAAFIQNLDLLITIDSAPAHLAGAMGKPVWTLLPFVPDWRWMLERADSPWYPTMRLFRQPRIGDWPSVLARVAADLLPLSRYSGRG